jgi:hypothetical protein
MSEISLRFRARVRKRKAIRNLVVKPAGRWPGAREAGDE